MNQDGSAFGLLYSFGITPTDGIGPIGILTLSLDGNTLYGVTEGGGSNALCGIWGCGSVFKVGIDGSGYQTLYSFGANASDGIQPDAGLILSQDGSKLFGDTYQGGSSNEGTVFSIGTDGSGYQILHSFDGSDGYSPQGALALSPDGTTLFGMASQGGSGIGTVFSIKTDGTGFQVLHNFGDGSNGDGTAPVGSLSFSQDGSTLYGETEGGGSNGGYGTIFSMGVDGSSYQTLYSFSGGANGMSPGGNLLLSQDGSTLYGITESGGSNSVGTVFSIGTNGSGFLNLYSFGASATDGKYPTGSLILSADGSTVYGSAENGGSNSEGSIFSIGANGLSYGTVYTFGGDFTQSDGQNPASGLVLSSDGNTLYGTSWYGGSDNFGVIFSEKVDGTGYTLLHTFGTAALDGHDPEGSLILSQDGSTLYGMTNLGGSNGDGTVYSIRTDGSAYQTLYSFAGAPDGAVPSGNLTLSKYGSTLYGMTAQGGSGGGNGGTIFTMGTNGSGYRVLYSFGSNANDALALTEA